MRGILLTYDTQLGLAELLHKSYAELWPDFPVTFSIPFNGSANGSAHTYLSGQSNCEFVACGRSIRESMRALLRGVDDDEWVYWCIDDRYPTWLDQESLRAVIDALPYLPEDVEEVKLLRWKEKLTTHVFEIGGQPFNVQTAGQYWGYWHHRPVRARVLRRILLHDALADECSIRDIQRLLLASAGQHISGRALVPGKALITLAEPLVDRQLTRNGIHDLLRFGCEIPPYESSKREVAFTSTKQSDGSESEETR